MEITFETITPEKAKFYLAFNTENRRVSREIVDKYARQMKAGKWKSDTAEPIKFAKNRILLDGQHRLLAIVKAGVSVKLEVRTGLDSAIFDVLDTGKSRNSSDVFAVAKIKQSNSIPSIIATYHLLLSGKDTTGGHNRLTNAELLDKYHENELRWQSIATKALSWYNSFAKIIPPSLIGGFYALFSNIDEDQADAFLEQLCSGQNIQNNTIALLRQKLMSDKMSLRKTPTAIKNAYIIKTWNAYRKRTICKVLAFNPAKDSYPIAI